MRYHVLLAVTLLLPAAAWTQPRHDDRQEYGNDARYPDSTQLDQVLSLAHELENASRHTYGAGRSSLRSLDRSEEKALRKLNHLADRARRFHYEVKRNRQDPAHTQDDFQSLVHSYTRARDAVRGDLRTAPRVRDDFRRVEALMEKLTGFYGGAGYYERIYPAYFGTESH